MLGDYNAQLTFVGSLHEFQTLERVEIEWPLLILEYIGIESKSWLSALLPASLRVLKLHHCCGDVLGTFVDGTVFAKSFVLLRLEEL